MNAKNVLNRIATLLSLDEKEVNFTDATTKDGTILQSPTFDVGETVDVIDADGKKTPAPDGEHEISLRDSEGNETLIKIMTMDGKIVERENVELPEAEMEMADATTEEAKSLPNTTDESDANEVATPDTENPIISLGYRIDELEKAMTEMKSMFAEMKPNEEVVDKKAAEIATEKDVEMELPKLDGAPVEQINRFSQENFNNFGKKTDNPQGSVLSKMYR
jgi:hypothetical protein